MYNPKNILFSFLTVILIASCKPGTSYTSLPRSTPESEGVSSEAILNFVQAADKEVNEIHSFMFLRHGKVIAEGWWNPYRSDLKHTMYSLSKSFTSTAVGFAADEKLLTVDDRVISAFPYEVPETLATKLASMTVKDLLTMSAGQDPDPTFRVTRNSENWVKAFLNLPVIYEPGTKFLYNSLATYMLSAIVQKVTGQKIIDYLTPRLFEPLGITGADWELNSQGVNTGGWGLRIRTEDIAKVGQLYLQKGSWNGKQILSGEWIEEATSFKIDQAPEAPGEVKDSSDWMQGYCYQFWRCRHNAYRGDGAYGQFMIVMPDQDAVIAMTSQTTDMQKELNLVWQYLLPAMKNEKLPPNEKAETELKEKLSTLALPIYRKLDSSTLEKDISGKTYLVQSNENHINSIKLDFSDSLVSLTMKKDYTDYVIDFTQGSWHFSDTELQGPNLVPNKKIELLRPFKIAGSYTWLDNNTIEFTLRYIESPHTETITCIFLDNKVGISMKNIFNKNKVEPLIEGMTADI